MKFRIVFAVAVLATALQANACDVCATHVALTGKETAGATTLSLFQQYSEYGRPSGGGHRFKSSSTQIAVSHWLTERWALQVGVPVLYRKLDDQSEQGVGDATAIVLYRAFDRQREVDRVIVDVYAGITMPTGDTDPLKGERSHHHGSGHGAHHAGHHGTSSHGHDGHSSVHGGHHIALGSGSWDFLFGGKAALKHGLNLVTLESQYNLRTEGDHGFRHGDEWVWRLGAHRYLLLDMDHSLTLGAELSGEWRDENRVDGVARSGSDKTGTYMGPVARYTRSDRLSLGLGVDIPVTDRNKGTGGAADFRMRANAAWSF